jgi:hypothetical protein
MKTALHALIESAPVCKPIKADLRASTTTFAWPDNVLVQRAPYVVLPLAEVEQAQAKDNHIVHFAQKRGRPYFRSNSEDQSYSMEWENASIDLWFQRFPDRRHGIPAGTWYGSENITDGEGKSWTRTFGRLVVNDFGELVNLKTGAAP